ncbi:sulfite exporter TauE/SafE family protein [Thioalkalivibrio paradoxus]|uniref:Probable membrane transporter protein n=1 Tax=Thioalkalivibrio paradoxus ARh 1 TaxID=713585 RepID=W0DK23_9GAMM|nr:sulfite exporter TauE/SafE family protein [Thioalkalivibrio paradoxus]AHE97592.1 hypothetical protein THITH_04165 [Thioalkalivibrio paradoxus ARh 1]
MDAYSLNEILVALLIVAFAGAVHGTFGLGFPMVATPVLALLTDVQTAILLTLAPTMAVNLWTMLRGGNLAASVGRFWFVAVWMLVGSAVGTLVLVALDPNPFRLLLALVILLYLMGDRLKRVDWSWIPRYPRASGAGAGMLGGLLGGTVNVGGPALMIYFLEMRVPALVMVQAINLAFLLGKSTQAATFAAVGELTPVLLLVSLPLGVCALAGLRAGMWLSDRCSAEVYRHWLRRLLWLLAGLLVVQFLRDL